jgi:hypothetical protein
MADKETRTLILKLEKERKKLESIIEQLDSALVENLRATLSLYNELGNLSKKDRGDMMSVLGYALSKGIN